MNNDKTTISSDQFAQPKISTKRSISPVWILPIVALMIGLGLIIKSYLSAGIMITLQVKSAEGIEVGKTKVLYKGITAGVVKNYEVSKDLQTVILHVEMDKNTKPFLNDMTRFWIVEPRVSLSGVSGLDTILSGRYIAVDASASDHSRRDFVALDVPPPPSDDTPGLHIKLRLNRLASIDRGTAIFYKQLPIGEVTNYTLEENDTEIHAWVLIQPKYAHLVRQNSLFYNISGLKVHAGLAGVKVETESLLSVLVGGIAMHTPVTQEPSLPAKHGAQYLLYDDFEAANIGIPLVLRFKNVEAIQEEQTEIRYQGHKIGRIGRFNYDRQTNETVVVAHIIPSMEEALNEHTQFWIVKPSVSLLKLTGLDALMAGNYVEMRPSNDGEPKRDFLVSESIPPLPSTTPGLHFYIETETLGSIDKDVPLLYRNIQVGNIEGYELSKDADKVLLQAYIKPEFAHLVRENSRFYNISGLSITGGVTGGIEIQTESLRTLLAGGIAFYTPDFEPEQPVSNNGDRFTLYNDFDDAKAGIKVALILDDLTGLSVGSTKVIYKGVILGEIKDIEYIKGKKRNEGQAIAHVVLDPLVRRALVEDTRFWVVKPKISLSGVENLESLFTGNYITLSVGSSKKPQHTFKVHQKKPPLEYTTPGLHLKLKSSELGSVKIGSPVMYQRIKIGDVQDYELASDRKSIHIIIHIWPQYSDLITSQTRFYNASGFQIDAGLTGIELRTESIDSILNGGIAIFNPGKDTAASKEKLTNGTLFKLFKDYDAARKNAFYVRVKFNTPQGLSIGSRVFYRDIAVGDVQAIQLDENKADSVWITLELDSSIKPLLGRTSRFWVSKARLGLARTENLQNLVQGNSIHVEPVKGRFSQEFTGLEEKPLHYPARHDYAVSLTASRLSSVKVGDPVYYRQVKVGEVIAYELADTADQILIHLRIRKRFQPLIRENSRFWHASGIDMNISLFGTSTVRTESLESLLAGGIAFATPDNDTMGSELPSGSFFVLHDKPLPEWTTWNPIIQLSRETQQD